MKGREFAISICISLLLATLVIVNLPQTSAFTPHDPIVINGDGEFNASNGVTSGTGTSSDPYIIEGWEVDASFSHGIVIENTNAHFIIRDCWVHGDWMSDGIRIVNAQNAKVQYSAVERMFHGIRFIRSPDGLIENSTVLLNSWNGILVYQSDGATIRNNSASRNSIGIYIHQSNGTTIQDNTASSNTGTGIQLSSSGVTVRNNEASSNEDYGIVLSSASSLVVGNTLTKNSVGMFTSYSTHNTIMENRMSKNNFGLKLAYSSDSNTIANNTINSNELDGLNLSDSDNNTIVNNTISFNNRGIYLEGCEGNLIHHNSICTNVVQAEDDGSNQWDNGYPSGGNYWNDYLGEDRKSGPDQDRSGSDRLGDSPYEIEGGCVDRYPLMEPFVEGRASVAEIPWIWVGAVAVLLLFLVVVLLLARKGRKRRGL